MKMSLCFLCVLLLATGSLCRGQLTNEHPSRNQLHVFTASNLPIVGMLIAYGIDTTHPFFMGVQTADGQNHSIPMKVWHSVHPSSWDQPYLDASTVDLDVIHFPRGALLQSMRIQTTGGSDLSTVVRTITCIDTNGIEFVSYQEWEVYGDDGLFQQTPVGPVDSYLTGFRIVYIENVGPTFADVTFATAPSDIINKKPTSVTILDMSANNVIGSVLYAQRQSGLPETSVFVGFVNQEGASFFMTPISNALNILQLGQVVLGSSVETIVMDDHMLILHLVDNTVVQFDHMFTSVGRNRTQLAAQGIRLVQNSTGAVEFGGSIQMQCDQVVHPSQLPPLPPSTTQVLINSTGARDGFVGVVRTMDFNGVWYFRGLVDSWGMWFLLPPSVDDGLSNVATSDLQAVHFANGDKLRQISIEAGSSQLPVGAHGSMWFADTLGNGISVFHKFGPAVTSVPWVIHSSLPTNGLPYVTRIDIEFDTTTQLINFARVV